MSNVKDRIIAFIKAKRKNISEFEKEIGVSSGYISNISKSIQPDKLEIISDKYPELSIEWLLIGKGSMLKPEQIPSIKERLLYFLKEQNLETRDFCDSIDMSFPYFSVMQETLPERYIKSIMEKYPQISIGWLMSGEGSMLRLTTEVDESGEQIALVPISNTVNYKLVPLLNLDAVGGMHSTNIEAGDSEFTNSLIPFTDAQDGDVALMVSGESMSPTCPSGSKILIREVPKWNEYLGYGNLFVLLLTDGRRVLKEIQKWQEDPKNFVLCKSHNDKYPEEELPKSMISGVWKVIKILNERGW